MAATTSATPRPSRRRRAAGRWSLALLVVVCVATVSVGWATKARCLGDERWQDGEQYRELCFTDVAVLWFGRGLADGQAPYLDADLEYPVLLGGQAWALASVALALGGGVLTFLALHAVAAAGMAVAVLLALHALGVPPPRLWWWAAGPPLALYAAWNWDLLALSLLVGAVLLHVQGRDGASGALAGLGAAAKLFPALLVPAVVVGHVRAGEPRRAVRHAGAAAAAWLVVNAPVALAAPGGWWHFYERSIERSPNRASTWGALRTLTDGGLSEGAAEQLSRLALVVGTCAILAVAARRFPPRETWRAILPLVAWFLVANKVHSPQFDLWLLPLLVLLAPIGPLVAFVAVGAVVVVVEMLHLGARAGATAGPGAGWLVAVVAARAAVLLWIVVAGLRGGGLTATWAAAAGRPRRRPRARGRATAAAGTSPR